MVDWDLPRDPLEALRTGNPAPFEGFVRSHARLLFDFFRRQGAEPHLAEDLVQEVFLKLFDHAPRYRNEQRFRALVYRVARNVWIDSRRRAAARGMPPRGEGPEARSATRRGEPQVESRDERAVAEPGPAERVSAGEEGARLRAALQRLPESHRAVFELSVLEDLGHAEIASVLDIPVGTVKSRLYYAVRKLRHAVGEESDTA